MSSTSHQPTVLGLRADPEQCRAAVAEIFERFPLEPQGKTILVKPNILGPHPLHHHTTTHPALVREIVAYLLEHGAHVLVGDNPGVSGYGMNQGCADKAGIVAAAQGCFVNLSKDAQDVAVNLALVKQVPISKEVLNADLVISVPRFKTHSLTLITGAIKNTFGYIPGATKARLHHLFPDWRSFSEMIVEVFAIRKPDLTIMDAFTAMEGNGPSGAPLRPLGRLIAAKDAVALDTVMAWMMGLKAEQVPQLVYAATKGLGCTDLNQIAIEGNLEPIPRYQLPNSITLGVLSNLVNRLVIPQVKRAPRIVAERCIHCLRCVEVCPEGAISPGQPPTLDRQKCISCYCCLENCADRAIVVSGSWLTRTRNWWLRTTRREDRERITP